LGRDWCIHSRRHHKVHTLTFDCGCHADVTLNGVHITMRQPFIRWDFFAVMLADGAEHAGRSF
jgi:hypothetical protein